MKRWTAIGNDPNSFQIKQERIKDLSVARNWELIPDRVEYLKSLASGKKVLDVGVVEHTISAQDADTWLHKNLCKVADYCLGVDILEAEVNSLKSIGFNVVCFDLVKAPLQEDFDLIICGELIEHISNLEGIFSSFRSMLRPHGRIVVTTPNPYYLNVIAKNTMGHTPFTENVDHIAWFDPSMMAELASRFDLHLERFSGVKVCRPKSWQGKVLFTLSPSLVKLGMQPMLFSKTIIYELVHS